MGRPTTSALAGLHPKGLRPSRRRTTVHRVGRRSPADNEIASSSPFHPSRFAQICPADSLSGRLSTAPKREQPGCGRCRSIPQQAHAFAARRIAVPSGATFLREAIIQPRIDTSRASTVAVGRLHGRRRARSSTAMPMRTEWHSVFSCACCAPARRLGTEIWPMSFSSPRAARRR
jgi:hypothetical protein